MFRSYLLHVIIISFIPPLPGSLFFIFHPFFTFCLFFIFCLLSICFIHTFLLINQYPAFIFFNLYLLLFYTGIYVNMKYHIQAPSVLPTAIQKMTTPMP